MTKPLVFTEKEIVSRIYLVRDQKVMLDSDLAEMYGVETRVLNQAVKRNLNRFPLDFMFQLTDSEWENLISQNVISSWGGRRILPYAFTEHGVLMLSSVLKSEQAVAVNIKIMRIYTKMREALVGQKDVLLKLEQLEKNMLLQDAHLKKHEDEIEMVFEALKQLLNPPAPPGKKIGYKYRGNED
ncbi:MAG: hypothetical protein FD123_879 [Bacteroidetes bacterium]|nr:MAG: hypothetical protein FD123_879 [Bacteroidota bacterium]